MTDSYKISRKACADGDTSTGANLTDEGGYVVKDEGSDFASLCISASTTADRPLGVIEKADDATFGRATIICHGPALCIAGADIDPGGSEDTQVMVHTDGTVIPLAIPADSSVAASVWAVGFIISETGAQSVSAGEQIRIYVHPTLYGNRYAAP